MNSTHLLYLESIASKTRIPKWLTSMYLSAFGPPVLGKRIRYRNLLPHLKKTDLKGKSCLDFGAGIGDLSFCLHSLGAEADAVEIDKEKCRIAGKLCRQMGLNIRFAEQIPKNKRYDYVFAIAVLEHIEDDKKMLSLLAKKLKKRGKLFVQVPEKDRKINKNHEQIEGHVRPGYDVDQLKSMLEDAGLSTISVRSFVHFDQFYYFNSLVEFFCKLGIRRDIAHFILFHAFYPCELLGDLIEPGRGSEFLLSAEKK